MKKLVWLAAFALAACSSAGSAGASTADSSGDGPQGGTDDAADAGAVAAPYVHYVAKLHLNVNNSEDKLSYDGTDAVDLKTYGQAVADPNPNGVKFSYARTINGCDVEFRLNISATNYSGPGTYDAAGPCGSANGSGKPADLTMYYAVLSKSTSDHCVAKMNFPGCTSHENWKCSVTIATDTGARVDGTFSCSGSYTGHFPLPSGGTDIFDYDLAVDGQFAYLR